MKPEPRPLDVPAAAAHRPQEGQRFVDVVELMNRLLAEDGCPWDREQTLATLKPYLLEEAHEVLEALEGSDPPHHREELGDLLFQIVFQSALRKREGTFDIDQVCTTLVDKMVRRHPHVFGDVTVKDSKDVLVNWGQIKAAEKKAAGKSDPKGALDGVPVGLPALLRAQRLGEKAAGVGFDWPDLDGVRDKLREELAELDEALASKLDCPPEDVLRAANARFVARFTAMEQAAAGEGHAMKELTLDQMNAYWDRAKTQTS